MSEQSTGAVNASVPTSRFPEAYARHADAMRALPAESLQQININIPFAVTAILGSMPEIMALRPRIVAELRSLDIAALDQLESSTLAMSYADTMFAMSTRKPEPVPELVQRAARWCAILRADAQALALRQVLDGAPLEQLRGGSSHGNIALDLFALAYLLRRDWDAIQGKTALSLAELSEAEQLADQLTTALGLRQQAPGPETPSADMRLRSFNLFLRNYKEVLRAVRFFCPETYEDFIPSIHTPRGPAKKRAAEERPAPADTGVHPAVHLAAQALEREAEPIAVGMPGASPYTKT